MKTDKQIKEYINGMLDHKYRGCSMADVLMVELLLDIRQLLINSSQHGNTTERTDQCLLLGLWLYNVYEELSCKELTEVLLYINELFTENKQTK